MKKLAVDIGGASIRIAIIEDKKIFSKETFETNPNDFDFNLKKLKL
ncbi:hypothetical protein [Spiroplasma taiwanense]|uniref:ROK family protein n=1 Tax=Spiroplasma taiwanense CT-1 TaxID=1276220 RepID=S5LUD0_9MOLU|nr:hypothetical protein [Spiroplasma taiwanense]AGR41384.1 hypothetical protein STAIW_v1c07960 [Spiroplasma taiwanense CT-1]